MNARYLAIAKNPQIIAGVHHYCDEWCDYCPVTSRCLAFRCTEEFRRQQGRTAADPTFASMDEAIQFTRELSAIEGVRTDELDALVSHPHGLSGVNTSDPLAGMAWAYAERAAVLLAPVTPQILMASPRTSPSPEEVLLWYHLRIYMRVFRALVSAETHSGGAECDEARGCAKLSLVSIDRSRRALRSLYTIARNEEVEALIALLDGLERGLEARFPKARAFGRVGLDYLVA